jgi:hypothetical protein
LVFVTQLLPPLFKKSPMIFFLEGSDLHFHHLDPRLIDEDDTGDCRWAPLKINFDILVLIAPSKLVVRSC